MRTSSLKRSGRADQHYTLIELCVSAGCIFLLGSLSSAGLELVHSKGEQLRCSLHLRSLSVATENYLENYTDLYPHEDKGSTVPPTDCDWMSRLGVSPYECGEKPEGGGYTLKMNTALEDHVGKKGYASPLFRKRGTITSPYITPYLFDGRVYVVRRPKGSHTAVASRHEEKANVLMIDGSVLIKESDQRPQGGWKNTGGLQWDPDVSLEDQ